MYIINKDPDKKFIFGPFSYEEMANKMVLITWKIYHQVNPDTDMRKVEILPQTDFWGFEISSK